MKCNQIWYLTAKTLSFEPGSEKMEKESSILWWEEGKSQLIKFSNESFFPCDSIERVFEIKLLFLRSKNIHLKQSSYIWGLIYLKPFRMLIPHTMRSTRIRHILICIYILPEGSFIKDCEIIWINVHMNEWVNRWMNQGLW